MELTQRLLDRSANQCELCRSSEGLQAYDVYGKAGASEVDDVVVCGVCLDQIENRTELDIHHWHCLSESMWSEYLAVQVLSWRLLNRLKQESWASDNLDMLYLDEETQAWAEAGLDDDTSGPDELHKDSNGQVLQNGDSVVLTRSLDVKGSTLNAKMGTVVKNIRLVVDNSDQIEGKVEGQQIVILTKYLRRQ